MERTLQHQWREAAPAKLEFPICVQRAQCSDLLAFTDQLVVISSVRSWSGQAKISLVNIKEGLEMLDYSCTKAGRFPDALISQDILLLVWRINEVLEVLAWNVHTKRKIFDKKLPAETVVFDHHNKQVMAGKKTRLEIRGNRIKTNKTPLPRSSSVLRAFSHPYYLTGGPGGEATALWKVDGTEVRRVGDLGAVGRGSPVFCPAREIIVFYSVLPPDKLELKFFSSSCHIIQDRLLTAPTVFYGISSLQVNDNQVVVMVRQQPGGRAVILVYQLECLLSQSADQDISPRMLDIGQSGLEASFHLSNTSVSAGLARLVDTFKIITMDFWNCEN